MKSNNEVALTRTDVLDTDGSDNKCADGIHSIRTVDWKVRAAQNARINVFIDSPNAASDLTALNPDDGAAAAVDGKRPTMKA